jgi:hypothetical protein
MFYKDSAQMSADERLDGLAALLAASFVRLKCRKGHPPTGDIGLYTYYERLAQGLRQLMAGSRKLAVEYISRDDLAALTREAAEVSGVQYVTNIDQEEAARILDS